jgi:hypothetical protein
MYSSFQEVDGVFKFATVKNSNDLEEIQKFLEDAINARYVITTIWFPFMHQCMKYAKIIEVYCFASRFNNFECLGNMGRWMTKCIFPSLDFDYSGVLTSWRQL